MMVKGIQAVEIKLNEVEISRVVTERLDWLAHRIFPEKNASGYHWHVSELCLNGGSICTSQEFATSHSWYEKIILSKEPTDQQMAFHNFMTIYLKELREATQ